MESPVMPDQAENVDYVELCYRIVFKDKSVILLAVRQIDKRDEK